MFSSPNYTAGVRIGSEVAGEMTEGSSNPDSLSPKSAVLGKIPFLSLSVLSENFSDEAFLKGLAVESIKRDMCSKDATSPPSRKPPGCPISRATADESMACQHGALRTSGQPSVTCVCLFAPTTVLQDGLYHHIRFGLGSISTGKLSRSCKVSWHARAMSDTL